MVFIILNTGILLAREKNIPAAELASRPIFCPTAVRGLSSTFVNMESSGKVPSKTMAIPATVLMASSMGAIPGMSTTPVMNSKAAAVRPTVIKMITNFPNMTQPLVIASGINFRPMARRIETIKTGTVLSRTMTMS